LDAAPSNLVESFRPVDKLAMVGPLAPDSDFFRNSEMRSFFISVCSEVVGNGSQIGSLIINA